MNTDEILHVFFSESRELLEQMESNLLDAERGKVDAESINSIFRAAHTIKGSAGIFGLDEIVKFTHVVENVLDEVRAGRRALDQDLVALMLKSCDHMGALVDSVAQGGGGSPDLEQTGAALQVQLKALLGATAPAPAAAKGGAMVEGSGGSQVESESCELVASEHWHLSLRFGPDILRHGLDPLSFIRYLKSFGEIVHLVTLTGAVPRASEFDPEASYLGYEISFSSKASKAEIEGVFDFLRDDSTIHILPPRSKISEYSSVIASLPEEDMKLGEILIRCGTLTQNELNEALRSQAAHDSKEPIGEVLVNEAMVQPAVVEAALEKQRQVKEHRASEGALVRVDADKLDHHINLVGELIIASASATLAAQQSGSSELTEITSTLARLVEEVRDSALTLRMVQIGATFNRFQRVVRDVSRELGKDIDLIISGGDTELDKTVVERIGDPLTHLVRNAMDHGIESAELRRAAGKPVKGSLRLNAYHDSGSIIIEVADDGGGLNKDRILAKAVEKGLVSPDQNLSEREIFNLIFEPGFSTAAAVSNLSGRGVGMDVVRRNIQALRGSVELDSELGKGTTVRIRLPLTLAIIDGFLVGVGDTAYVIPLETVVECIEHGAMANDAGEEQYLNLRGEVLPYLRIREHFSVKGEKAARENIVVVRHGGRKAGLAVDRLMGEFQTVIRPLGKVFNGIAGVGGFTILGSGEVAMILDVPGLLKQVSSEAEPGARRALPASRGNNLH